MCASYVTGFLTENPGVERIKFQKVHVGLVPPADALVSTGALGLCCVDSPLLPVPEVTIFATLNKRGSLSSLTFCSGRWCPRALQTLSHQVVAVGNSLVLACQIYSYSPSAPIFAPVFMSP